MKWEKCSLIKSVADGADELGNPIYKQKTVHRGFARVSPFDVTDIELSEQKITENSRKFLIRSGLTNLPAFDFVIYKGVSYEVKQITDHGRITFVYGEHAK